VLPPPLLSRESLLATAAVWNRHLVQTLKPADDPRTDQELLRQTRGDSALGLASGPFALEQLDAVWGANGWRAVPRHGLWQEHNGKLRPIDNARASSHNEATSETERLRVISGDVVPAAGRRLLSNLSPQQKATLSLHGTSEDWTRGYRQRACDAASLALNVVAFWHPELKKVLFWVYFGLLFGLASSVISFNRTPALLVAVLRRVAGVPSFHYFDDLGLVDLSSLSILGQKLVRLVHSSAGFLLDSDKALAPDVSWVFLGILYLLEKAFSNALIVADAKPGRRAAILAIVNTILDEKLLSRLTAGKLRGKSHFLANSMFGRMGRAPESALVRFEHDKDLDASGDRPESQPRPLSKEAGRGRLPMPPYLENALELLRALILRAPARTLFLQPRYRAPTLIYTDASFELNAKTPCRVGIVVFSERARRPQGFTTVVSKSTLDALLVRLQQITQAETLAAPALLVFRPDLLQDTDVIWFLDNSGAEAGLISGYSSCDDSASILGFTHICLASLNSRAWFEHVPSDENPSDGLSRDGLDDKWTKEQGWDLTELPFPDFSNLIDLPLSELLKQFTEVIGRVQDADILVATVPWKIPDTSKVDLLKARLRELARLQLLPRQAEDLLAASAPDSPPQPGG
jgi:hypothetical protein